MFSRGGRSEKTTNGRGNNVVERPAIPGVEKPDAWNSCVTDPGEDETSQRPNSASCLSARNPPDIVCYCGCDVSG